MSTSTGFMLLACCITNRIIFLECQGLQMCCAFSIIPTLPNSHLYFHSAFSLYTFIVSFEDTGELMWRRSIGKPVFSSPVVTSTGNLVVAAVDSVIYCFDSNGQQVSRLHCCLIWLELLYWFWYCFDFKKFSF